MGRSRHTVMTRRAFVAGMGAAGTALLLGGCANSRAESAASATAKSDTSATSDAAAASETQQAASGRTLVVFFSRAGENYSSTSGTMETQTGNTEVMAGYIEDVLDCDAFKVEPADPYPHDYLETCDRAQAELDADARPAAGNLAYAPDLSAYDTVLVGAPVWWGHEPRVMMTYLESQDWTGKTVIPFTTHGGSGLGSAVEECRGACAGAQVDAGRAYSHAGESIASAGDAVRAWARGLGLAAK